MTEQHPDAGGVLAGGPVRIPGEAVAMSGDDAEEDRPQGAAAVPGAGDDAWWIYRGTGVPSEEARPLAEVLPPPPPWRDFDGGPVISGPPPPDEAETRRRLGVPGDAHAPAAEEADMVNAAMFLRRPLLVTGPPGIGKSSLAYRISRELGLGKVLRWTITSRSTLTEGLYSYDAIGRVQDAAARGALRGLPGPDGRLPEADGAGPEAADTDGTRSIGDFVQLGPLGTALLPREAPRVLLIDEFDKADTDLANDLLGAFEDGEFRIPELARVRSRLPEAEVHTDDPEGTAVIRHGAVRCRAFPVVVITSNGERSLPPPLLRRCLCLDMPPPDERRLAAILAAQFGAGAGDERAAMIRDFLARSRVTGTLAADQLLNSEYLRTAPTGPGQEAWDRLLHALWQRLDEVGPG
ncbi:MoxR family ATPase [Streptomyces sp. ACA25]|uniref:AAA family ATPase n=1 Tax=Streptomyces sp. ACA25 TaxID=3022596 RepID=UPI002307708C|nr:MoxR family ATPase [Streptomyces sp. ACA25]MDB1088318.1 MoxR family ATPase [Streptomyces sp. ACA25]